MSDQYPRIRVEVSIGATTFTVDYTIDWCDDSGERWAEIIDLRIGGQVIDPEILAPEVYQQIEQRIQP